MSDQVAKPQEESALITVVGWGGLLIFAIWFAYQIGAPLMMQQRWAEKQKVAIELVKNQKPTGGETLYDMIRAYSLKAKAKDIYVGEFSWSATQKDGPEYEVKLLWTEGSQKRVAIWKADLQANEITPKPKGEASTLTQHLAEEPVKQAS